MIRVETLAQPDSSLRRSEQALTAPELAPIMRMSGFSRFLFSGGSHVTKQEFAEKLSGKTDISKAKAIEVIDSIFSTKPGHGIIAVELDAGRKVNITGFGNFTTKNRAGRQGRNPATGETIWIAPKTYAHFSASKGLKDRVAE